MKKFFAIITTFIILFFSINININNANANLSKEVYITFDDGPTVYTEKILNILKNYDIKASFFVVGSNIKQNSAILKKIYKQGHTIGVHCYSHIYKQIYKDNYSFYNDLIKCINIINEILPYYNIKYYRFPGGSFGKSKNFIDIVKSFNLEIVDWNCISGDSEIKNITQDDVISTVKNTSLNKKRVILLLHDNKKITAQTLESILCYFIEKGYNFKKLV